MAPLLDPAKLSLCVIQPFTLLGVRSVVVTATYDFVTITPGLDGLIGPMSAQVTCQY